MIMCIKFSPASKVQSKYQVRAAMRAWGWGVGDEGPGPPPSSALFLIGHTVHAGPLKHSFSEL